MLSFASSYNAARQQLILERKKTIQAELKRYMLSPAQYTPSVAFAQNRPLLVDFYRYTGTRFGVNGCRCEKQGEEPKPEPPKPKYGLVTQKLKCYNQCESGHGEVYLVCAAVDGNGKYVQTVSPKYSIDDDEDNVLYPHHWIYPTQDVNGFLDHDSNDGR